MFLRGIARAFEELTMSLPGEQLHVVYAGTGPLAPLVAPLLAFETWARATVTFIDIHPDSIAGVRRIVETLGSRGHEFVVADATAYQHAGPIHLAISETMQRALTVEPQVAIAANLAAQLHPRGVFVPSSIRIELCGEEAGGEAYPIATILEVSVAAMRLRELAPPCVVTIPATSARLFYRTTVHTHGEFAIQPGQSGITAPEYVWDLAGTEHGDVVRFWYEISARPGIRHERTSGSVSLV